MDGISSSMDMSLSTLWEIVKNREGWRAAVHGVTKSWTLLSDKTPPPKWASLPLFTVQTGLLRLGQNGACRWIYAELKELGKSFKSFQNLRPLPCLKNVSHHQIAAVITPLTIPDLRDHFGR